MIIWMDLILSDGGFFRDNSSLMSDLDTRMVWIGSAKLPCTPFLFSMRIELRVPVVHGHIRIEALS